jgi:hypothetical protein
MQNINPSFNLNIEDIKNISKWDVDKVKNIKERITFDIIEYQKNKNLNEDEKRTNKILHKILFILEKNKSNKF